ncbi:MAG: electron transport complex subunit E [Deltaproteobacteria bacterium]|nr:electron transport complex subunit E [Deltaproteobacteria bacterium]MBN2670910.1 electron transport complex subunit E [Deltaproteobacteria bacterium]
MASKETTLGEIAKGLWRDNPVLVLLLGLCPTLAVTNSAYNGLGMGVATAFVLLGSNTLVSTLKSIIPKSVRIPVYIVVIATFVTIVDMLLKAYMYELSQSLGLFVPLIVVNCVILGRAEAFASKNSIGRSVLDALGMSLGFTLALFTLGAIREIIGSGTLTLFQLGETEVKFFVLGHNYPGILVMILPPGAFLTLGFMLAGKNAIQKRMK